MMIGQNLVPLGGGGSKENLNQNNDIRIMGASEIKQEPKYESDEEMGSEVKFESESEQSGNEIDFDVDLTKVERELKEEIFDEKSEQKPLNEEEIALPLQNDSNQKELKDKWSSCGINEAKKCVSTPKRTPDTDIYNYKKRPTALKDNSKRYKCNQYNHTCAYESHLKRHMLKHSGYKPFQCNQCNYACTVRCDLRKHMRKHTGEKPFKCNQCDFACAHRNSLKIHMHKHTGEKPFKCNQCEYSCVQKHSLKRHIRTHTDEKSYQYDRCSKKFCQKIHFPSGDPSVTKKQNIRVAKALWRPF